MTEVQIWAWRAIYVFAVALVVYGMGRAALGVWSRWFAKRYICHRCQDAENMMTRHEYERGDGTHDECPRPWTGVRVIE